jgi:gliding motility associated protien GldN
MYNNRLGNIVFVKALVSLLIVLGISDLSFGQGGIPGQNNIPGQVTQSSAGVLDLSRANRNNNIFVPQHTKEKKPITFSFIREADVIYSKRIWQVLDLREKINHSFYFPTAPKGGRASLWDVLKQGVLDEYQKDFTKMNFYAYQDDDFAEVLLEGKLTEIISGEWDTVWARTPQGDIAYDAAGNKIMENRTRVGQMRSEDVKRYKIKEIWYFDKQKSQLQVRILGIAPMVLNTQTDEWDIKFWLYFPDLRQILAQNEFFNPQNGAENRTFDDIFMKRMFSSYVTKVENVYDREISQYAVGMDALLESERIKTELSEIEQYMWEY